MSNQVIDSGPHALSRQGERSAKFISILTPFLAILIIFLLPEYIMSFGRQSHHHPAPPEVYLRVGIYIALFLINYFVIIRATIIKRRSWWMFLLCNLGLIAIALAAIHISYQLFPDLGFHHPGPSFEPKPFMGPHLDGADAMPRRPRLPMALVRDSIMMILSVALSVAIRLSNSINRLRSNITELYAIKNELELKQLKSQLNPHFLFNTLNTIYALVDIDASLARDAIHRLSAMLRYTLYETRDFVELRREIEFVADYVELMRLRLPGSIPLTVNLEAGALADREIPPLIFINIVDNMFKYGMKAVGRKGIDLSITASKTTIHCVAANYYTPAENPQNHSGKGIGLQNLRRRLDLRCSGRYSLKISDDGERYTIDLEIRFI